MLFGFVMLTLLILSGTFVEKFVNETYEQNFNANDIVEGIIINKNVSYII